MALQSFHRLPDLPKEIRIKIWQRAYLQRGPRIVKIIVCGKNHDSSTCYVKHEHLLWEELENEDDCCFHLNPATQNVYELGSCKCTVPHGWGGHRHIRAAYHIHGTKHSEHSALLSTNHEARYEAQRFGKIEYFLPQPETRSLCDYSSTTYIDFENDTLAIHYDDFRRWQCPFPLFTLPLKGLENVKSLLILPSYISVDKSILSTDWPADELFTILKPFASVQKVQVAQGEERVKDIWYTGALRVIHLSLAYEDQSYSKRPLGYIPEQVNRMREKTGAQRIPLIDSVVVRTSGDEED